MRLHLKVVVALSLAAALIGAWELAVTRLASVVYFFDLTYLALAVCLLGLSLGALWTRQFGKRMRLTVLLIILPSMMPAAWWLISIFDAAWLAGIFAWPFVVFGAATTLAWHRMGSSTARVRLYAGEMIGAVLGLVVIGPLLVSTLPIDVFGSIGIQTHLRNTVDREGLLDHQHHSSAYARTDLLRTSRTSVAYLFTDAMFVTRSVKWDGQSRQFDDPHVEDLARLKRLALLSAPRDDVLLLGAGAGFDMTVALQLGAGRIDAVEVNPHTIIFARTLDDWAGGVLSDARVNIHVAEARRFVATTDERWDHISLTLLQTSPAAGRGRSHVDGRVLTVEAIRTYLNHLKPLGVLAVIQNSPGLTRRTQLAMLTANGQAPDRILSLQLPEAQHEANPFSHLLLARNEPFSDRERSEVQGLADRFGAELITALPRPTGKPATDDRPFLFEPDIRIALYALPAASLSLLVLVIVLTRERRTPGNITRGSAAALIGAVSMALQVLIVYRIQTAVGDPALALSVALGAVLGGAGFGALVFGDRISQWRNIGVVAIAGVALLAVAGSPLAAYCAGINQSLAIAVMASFTVICCMPLGLPFLAVIQSCGKVSGHGEGLAIGCDGLGGVIGAATATGVAMTIGFNAVGWLLIIGFVGFWILRPNDLGDGRISQ